MIFPVKSGSITGVLCLLLAACSGPDVSFDRSDVVFLPDANGLHVQPSGLRIDFGRAPKGVIDTLDHHIGPHQVLGRAACPALIQQQMQWGDLVLSFSAEQFVGWRRLDVAHGQTCPA